MRILLTYLAFAVLPAAAAALVISLLRALPGVRGDEPAGQIEVPELHKVLIAVTLIVLLSRGFGALMVRAGQPRVVGEMLLGLLLGPSVLGLLLPAAEHWLFSPAVSAALEILAQFGVLFCVFVTGLEVPVVLLRGLGTTGAVLGHTCMAVPFLGGVLAAVVVADRYRPAHAGTVPFVLFCGLVMSITAFPVLARILKERELTTRPLGVLAVTAAGVADVTAWCGLAVVVTLVGSDHGNGIPLTLLWTVLFGLFMWFVVRPWLGAVLRRFATAGKRDSVMTVVLATLLLSALATELIGVHPIFGAFAAGLVMPRDVPAVPDGTARLEGFTAWVLLPLFFASVGLHTAITGLGGGTNWLVCVLAVLVAVAGKFAGTVPPARLLGLDRRSALSLGALLNCRGLTELVVLDLGLDIGVISSDLFAMLVVMTLVTTMLTGPMLTWFGGSRARYDRVGHPGGAPVPARHAGGG